MVLYMMCIYTDEFINIKLIEYQQNKLSLHGWKNFNTMVNKYYGSIWFHIVLYHNAPPLYHKLYNKWITFNWSIIHFFFKIHYIKILQKIEKQHIMFLRIELDRSGCWRLLLICFVFISSLIFSCLCFLTILKGQIWQ